MADKKSILIVVEGGIATVITDPLPEGVELEVVDIDNLKCGRDSFAALSKMAQSYVVADDPDFQLRYEDAERAKWTNVYFCQHHGEFSERECDSFHDSKCPVCRVAHEPVRSINEATGEIEEHVSEEDCDCADRSWYGEKHDEACPLAGQPNPNSKLKK